MLRQNINNPLAQQRGIVNTGGLAASPFTGSTNDVVLLFNGAGTVTGPTADIVETNSATDGTSITISAPGVYLVKLYVAVFELATVIFGISQDQTTNLAGADPAFATPGVLDVQTVTTAGVTFSGKEITRAVMVRPEDEGGSVIRFLCSDGSAGAPTALLTQAAVYYSIQQINQLHQ
jgi:hypothetical protein